MISQRIKAKNNGRRIGVFVAAKDEEGVVKFGYSLCSKEDQFDKEIAYKIAIGRLRKNYLQLPPSIVNDFYHFYDRAKRYFKDGEISAFCFK